MYVRKAVSINGFRAVLTAGAVARVGELACIDVATGLLRPGAAGAPTLRPIGTFTENLTGDGVQQTYAASPNELRAQEWLNDTVSPVVMPTNRGHTVYMLDAKTVTIDSAGGANAPAGVALDIDISGRVLVQAPIGLTSASGGGGGGGGLIVVDPPVASGATYNVAQGNEFVRVAPTGVGNISIVLPDAALFQGETVTVKKITADVIDAVDMTAVAGLIDGLASYPLPASAYSVLAFCSDGADWWVI